MRILAVLSTRRHRAGLEPIGNLESKTTTRSAISRRFVVGTTRKPAQLMRCDLKEPDLPALFSDGIETAEQTVVAGHGSPDHDPWPKPQHYPMAVRGRT